MTGAQKIGDLSIKLADAALVARERGDDVQALFFAVKAAECLQLAKALGWNPPSIPANTCQLCQREKRADCDGSGWIYPIGPCADGSYMTSRPCQNDDPFYEPS